MSATTVLIRGQAKAVEDSMEVWKREEKSRHNVHFVESLVPVVTTLVSLIDHQVRDSWRALQQSPATYPAQSKGEELAEGLALTVSATETLDYCLRDCEADGYSVDGAEEFRAVHARLTAAQERFLDGWPMLDLKAAEEAQARIDAGQFIRLEDLARAVDGPV